MNGPAKELLISLETAGLMLTPAAGRLQVTPASKLTDGQRTALKAHRDELLAYLIRREELDLYMLAQPPPLAAVGWILPPRSWAGGGRMASDGGGSAKLAVTAKPGTDCLPWSADRATYA